jgi:quercetin dioxygenase-like cupin family protein
VARYEDVALLDAPTLVRRKDAPVILWGDDTSGYVNDIIHVPTPQLVMVQICMPPGGAFRMSDVNRPVYDADACLLVLEGEYTVQLPETGEVRVAREGEVILLHGPEWHFGYNFSNQELRVLEAIAPLSDAEAVKDLQPPSQLLGVDSAAAKNYPASRGAGSERLQVVGRASALNTVIGTTNPVLLRVLASGPRVSSAMFDLIPGQHTETFCFAGDTALYVMSGRVHVRTPGVGGWDEADADDAFCLPGGTPWQVFNHGGSPASVYLAYSGNIGGELAAD